MIPGRYVFPERNSIHNHYPIGKEGFISELWIRSKISTFLPNSHQFNFFPIIKSILFSIFFFFSPVLRSTFLLL